MTKVHPTREAECERSTCGWPTCDKAVLNTLLENVSDVVIVASPDGQIQHISRPIPGSVDTDLVGTYAPDLIGQEHRGSFWNVYQDAIEAGEVRTTEVKLRSGRWLWCRIVPGSGSGALAETMIICTDVTRRKEAEDTAEEYEQFLEETFESHERLRRSVFCEIHEEIAQVITGALLHLQALARRHTEKGDESAEILDMVVRLLRESIIRSQEIANLLRPSGLDELEVMGATDGKAGETDGVSSFKVCTTGGVVGGRIPESDHHPFCRTKQAGQSEPDQT